MLFRVFFSLREEIVSHQEHEARVQRKVDRHKTYSTFLEKTLASAEDFHEIREIISRYDTLTATHVVS